MSDQTEKRPAGNGAASWNGLSSTAKSSRPADLSAALERADMALLVVTGLRNGGVRRKVVFTIAAALRALDLAAARGVPASVALVRLQPVERVDLDGIGGAR